MKKKLITIGLLLIVLNFPLYSNHETRSSEFLISRPLLSADDIEIEFVKKVGVPYFFDQPSDIAFSPLGYYYVASREHPSYFIGAVAMFSATGEFIKYIERPGDDAFFRPEGIAVNSTGHLYVSDAGNNRVQIFSPTGEFVRMLNGFSYPTQIAINGSDYIYIINGSKKIQIISPDGELLSNFGTFNIAAGIAINSTGHVYVTDRGNHNVQIYTQEGIYVDQFGSPGSGDGNFNTPIGISVNSTNQIYVVDQNNYRVQIFSNTGEFIDKFGTQGYNEGQFQTLWGIKCHPNGDVYVTDSSIHRVQIFSIGGSFIKQFGNNNRMGSLAGQFSYPNDVAMNSKGDVFVSDSSNDRISVFSPSGTPLFSFTGGAGGFDGIEGIALNSTDHIYAVDYNHNRIQIFSPTGEFIGVFGEYGTGDGKFDFPARIAINSLGKVYVTDMYNNRVQIFSPTGQYLGQFGGGNGGFDYPYGIAINATDHIYVTDLNNATIHIFDSNGVFIKNFGSYSSPADPGQFNSPYGIDFDAYGNVFIADANNQTIHIYSANGEFLTSFGESGYREGNFQYPTGLAISKSGILYVIDYNLNWLQIFNIGMPPQAPVLELVSPTTGQSNTVLLKWASGCYATTYKLYRANELITGIAGLTPIATIEGLEYSDSNLAVGKYYYVITSANFAFESGISNCVVVEITKESVDTPEKGPNWAIIGTLIAIGVVVAVGAVVFVMKKEKKS
jgi:sugar lactone lactonase YvrE